MGTRNLTIVKFNNEYKVAQYGQWDGYPDGNGVKILKFLTDHTLEDIKKKFKDVRLETHNDELAENKYLKSIGVKKDGMMNAEQAQKLKTKYPFLDRDMGANILQFIMNNSGEDIYVRDELKFAADSLFCEWAYVIDLDKNTFEIYEGFNDKQPLTKEDRFYFLNDVDKENHKEYRQTEYFPIRMIKSYSLDKLPTQKIFLKEMKKLERA